VFRACARSARVPGFHPSDGFPVAPGCSTLETAKEVSAPPTGGIVIPVVCRNSHTAFLRFSVSTTLLEPLHQRNSSHTLQKPAYRLITGGRTPRGPNLCSRKSFGFGGRKVGHGTRLQPVPAGKVVGATFSGRAPAFLRGAVHVQLALPVIWLLGARNRWHLVVSPDKFLLPSVLSACLRMYTNMSGQNSGDGTNYAEPVSTRLTPQLHDRFEEWREENELGRTEALRQLVEQGLSEDREPIRLASFIAAVAFLLLSVGNQGTSGGYTIGGIYITVTLFWASWPDIRNLYRLGRESLR